MSGSHPIATELRTSWEVRFVPIAHALQQVERVLSYVTRFSGGAFHLPSSAASLGQ